MKDYTVSYAQNREDIILDAFFLGENEGLYVDIGAFDPDYDSVTKLFYNRGWTGINIEPQPKNYNNFVEKRPNDINLNIGVSDRPGKLVLRSYSNGGLSTFSNILKNHYSENVGSGNTGKHIDITVKVETLKTIFEEYIAANDTIKFLKVDVEGFEYKVLAGNDWNKYRPEVICIEANHIEKDWRPLLERYEYELVFNDGLNNYYADRRTQRASLFNYVDNILYREPIVSNKLLADIQRLEKKNEIDQNRIDVLEKEIELVNKKRKKHLRSLIKNVIKDLDKKIRIALRDKTDRYPIMTINQKEGPILTAYYNKIFESNVKKRPTYFLSLYLRIKSITIHIMRKVI